jgi:ankyrin repeat protein
LPLIFCSSCQWAALLHAAYDGNPALCELLIAGKADVDAKNKCAFICLNLLLIFCCILFLHLLLIFSSSFQRTALHLAAGNGHPALCELLIAGKADVDAKDWCAFIF